jgi:hypothetical protein
MKTRHRNASTLMAAVLCATGFVAGCSTHRASQSISPRVEGRVLDSQTRQPVAEVEVRRFDPSQEASQSDMPRGGEIMQRTSPVLSQPDGSFVLESQRDLAVFRKLHWYSVKITFERAGYERFSATYKPVNATNSAGGEPVVFAGDILLKPVLK